MNNLTLTFSSDLPALVAMRRRVLSDVFGAPPTDALMEANIRYYAEAVTSGQLLPLLALEGDTPIGSGAICLQRELPSPDNPGGLCAWLMNIYVDPAYRRRGIARAIVHRLVDEARRRHVGKIWLESTPAAHPLYTALGFTPLPDILKL